jgi:hypothetical protein
MIKTFINWLRKKAQNLKMRRNDKDVHAPNIRENSHQWQTSQIVVKRKYVPVVDPLNSSRKEVMVLLKIYKGVPISYFHIVVPTRYYTEDNNPRVILMWIQALRNHDSLSPQQLKNMPWAK